jgi:hypothetical protein
VSPSSIDASFKSKVSKLAPAWVTIRLAHKKARHIIVNFFIIYLFTISVVIEK